MSDERFDRRGLAVLATGHLWADFLQGAIPALLPFLIAEHGYSYGAAGALLLAASLGSSIVQPLFGVASDRLSLPWLMPVGLALGGAGLAAVGLADSYAATFAAVVVSGLGVAAFHPEAARYANYASRGERGRGMSLFSLGGNAGFALGPLLVTPAVLAFGLPGTVLALIPLWLAAGLLVARARPACARTRPLRWRGERRSRRSGTDEWGPFARLASVVGLRSAMFFGLQAFVPVYFAVELGTSEAAGNAALSVMLVAGAVGTYVGGRLGSTAPVADAPDSSCCRCGRALRAGSRVACCSSAAGPTSARRDRVRVIATSASPRDEPGVPPHRLGSPRASRPAAAIGGLGRRRRSARSPTTRSLSDRRSWRDLPRSRSRRFLIALTGCQRDRSPCAPVRATRSAGGAMHSGRDGRHGPHRRAVRRALSGQRVTRRPAPVMA